MKSDLYSQIDRKFEESSTSNEGSDNELVADDNASLNSMYMKLDFLDRVKAEIIFNSLSVDKEPKRSTTRRLMSLDGTIITAKFSSDDQKSLIRSANNFFDMCQLSKKNMFKGLRSKLEDEAKRIQATVSQYGENLANQVRSNASDAGSDISGRGRKLIGNALIAVQPPDSNVNANTDTAENNDETIISFHDEQPNLDVAFPSDNESFSNSVSASSSAAVRRQRRLSNVSVESNESSFNFSSQIKTSPTLALDPICSDVESNAGSVADLSSLDNVPNEKITSIFQRLQGRAVDYKQKYRDLVKAYREIERENEKCQMVLASTQDKAMARINKLKEERHNLNGRCKELEQVEGKLSIANGKVQKMQELLSKCKDEITANRERILTLTEENNHLKEQENAEDSKEKLSAEWKGRFDRQEEEWTKRMGACEESATIAIATHKAEMHSALQQKDQEIEGWIEKCHSMEKRDTDSNTLWQEKVDTLQKAIVALEHEKADMVEKLSQAKQEGVKLVKESEEKRHGEILTEQLKKKDEEWSRRFKELEEQMQLAVEESDLQRKTSVTGHERELSNLRGRVAELEKENTQILQQFCGQKEELEQLKRKELTETEETPKERGEIQGKEREEREKMETKLAETERESNELKRTIETMEKEISRLVHLSDSQKVQLSEQSEKFTQLEAELQSKKDELETLAQNESQIEEFRANLKSAEEENSRLFCVIDELKKESQCQMSKTEMLLKEENGKISELETKMKDEKETFEAKLEKMKKEGEKEAQKGEEILRRAEKENREMNLEMEAIKKERDERKKEMEKQREQIIAFEEEKGHLKLELKSVKRELKGLKQIEAQMKEKVTEIERINGELRSTERTREEAMEKMKGMEKQLKEEEEKHRKETEQLKKEWDRAKQKGIADLQSEIRQLYHDINEKDCELATTHANISKLESELNTLRTKQENDKQNSQEYNPFTDGVDIDELLELRQRMEEREKEVQQLKAMVQQQNGHNNGISKSRSPTPGGRREFRSQLSNASDHLNFAEPTEAEYLRNVLYRYMTERETLGRESVTLAKVIATVCKFPPDQLSLVLSREEARCQAWLPTSVVHALTHPTLSQKTNALHLTSATKSGLNSSNRQQQQQHLMGGTSRQAPF
ncbi:hypothetical protein niasHS_007555 [Heterodera schachtii]|uniref:GRIP domain-containing protein n=1 Tax=Heterodera schachtii TaxID=97005 RepID=A0ABD2JXW4_HETSC